MEDQPLATSDETASDDRLWAALGYPIPIIALVLLFMEEKKDIPFLRFHAVQSIAVNIVIWVLIAIVVPLTLGVAGICAPLLWFATLWPAYDAFKGNYTEIPVITKFLKSKGWV